MSIIIGALASLIPIAIVVLVFLILRAFVLWYWRVDEALHILEWQKNLLNKSTEQNDRIIALLEKLTAEDKQGLVPEVKAE